MSSINDEPAGNARGAGGRPRAQCPICRRLSAEATQPFCSARCANVDLARWLGGKYVIATYEDAEEDETVTPASIAKRLAGDGADDDD